MEPSDKGTVQSNTLSTNSSPILLSSASSITTNRKGRSADPDTSIASVERSSVSVPPSVPLGRSGNTLKSSPISPSIPEDLALRQVKSDPTDADADQTPTIGSGKMNSAGDSFKLPESSLLPPYTSEGGADNTRLSFSSLYSVDSSAIVNQGTATGSVAGSESDTIARSDAPSQVATTAHSNVAVTASLVNGSLGVAPQSIQSSSAIEQAGSSARASAQPPPASSSLSRPPSYSRTPNVPGRSRSKNRGDRRVSRTVTGTNASPASDRPSTKEIVEKKPAPNGIIGVCALDTKARSKPSRNILNRMIANGEFDVIIFGDKVILDEDVENWPICDYLISFFSDGFPLDKAIAYEKLRKPFCVNNLPMQTILWDRRLCLMVLDSFDVLTPKRLEVNRDGGPKIPSAELATHLREVAGIKLPGPDDGTGGNMLPPKEVGILEDGDVLVVDGKQLRKPFVEKPVSGEDHNIHIYFPGGGGRRLFRKVNNKSSEADDSLMIPRVITEPENSYIYEEFVDALKSEDVKAYTVGPDYCHAETRKSPVVDGIVKRNPSGKEIRYVTELSAHERQMAARVVKGFGQAVCGFDLLRSNGKSYVIDVNGWSFVKDNSAYYEACARILKEMFVSEKKRISSKRHSQSQSDTSVSEPVVEAETSAAHRSLRDIFKSPSMAKLHHPLHHHNHGAQTADTVPLSSPPSIDNKARGMLSIASQPVVPVTGTDTASLSDSRPALSRTSSARSPIPPPASKAQWKLKGIVSVVRHADRTPKQKFKFTFHTKPFVDLLRGHQEEVLLVGEAALNSVLEAVQLAMSEGKEDMHKLQQLKTSLIKKGAWTGTKVQIKPMFRSRRPTDKDPKLPMEPTELQLDEKPALETGDSTQTVTLSRISAAENNLVLDKLQLIIKWGGEPTHSARYQAQDLGENLRNDLLLMNRECLEHVSVFSSSERRVTTSAQIFASAFLEEKNLPKDFVQVRKDLLDDSNAAKDEMDRVKKKLKQLLREGDAAPPEFTWPKNSPEPYIVARRIVELLQFHHAVMLSNFQKLQSNAANALASVMRGQNGDAMSSQSNSHTTSPTGSMTSAHMVSNIQPRWCSGEDGDLFRERWEKLFKEFTDADKVDPSKVSELYDTLKFDALHNRQFLEWVFMPDIELEAAALTDVTTPEPAAPSRSGTIKSSLRRGSVTQDQKSSKDWKGVAQKLGFRRPSEAEKPLLPLAGTIGMNANANSSMLSATDPENYFSLYRSPTSNSKVKHDSRLSHLRELYSLSKTLFDYIGPQEYGISPDEKLSIGLLTSLPLLKEIVHDLEEMQASDGGSSFFYFTKESHVYTLLNCIIEGGIQTKIERKNIPELDYLSQINFELYESQNAVTDEEEGKDRYNYSIRITLSPGCHTFDPLDLTLDSKHCIGIAARRSLTAHVNYKEVLETLKTKFHTVKLPKSFIAISIS